MHKDINGKPIKLGNVVTIHNKTWGSSMDRHGLDNGDIGVVEKWGCIILTVQNKQPICWEPCFNETDLEVIGIL